MFRKILLACIFALALSACGGSSSNPMLGSTTDGGDSEGSVEGGSTGGAPATDVSHDPGFEDSTPIPTTDSKGAKLRSRVFEENGNLRGMSAKAYDPKRK